MRFLKKDALTVKSDSGQGYDLQQLKILIVSTAKTGNTWLRHLLSTIYDLPTAEPPLQFDPSAINQLGARWVGHQHYHPQFELLTWAKQNNVVLLTTVRHPGDALVSLYHHVHNHPNDANYGVEAMLIEKDGDAAGQTIVAFVEGFFYVVLNTSITWIYTGRSQIVRYEELWRDPVATLVALTDRIYPVARDRVERAVEQCDISMMRKVSGPARKFFRQGGVGGWRKELSAEVIDLFRHHDPYPAQFAALGYTLDPADPLIDAPAVPRPEKNPFRDADHFDNSVSVPPIAARLYLSFDTDEARRRWPDPIATHSPDSFYAWMNAPAEQDPHRNTAEPVITNLTAYLRRIGGAFQELPGDIYRSGRADWAFWLLQNAREEYSLDLEFLRPLLAWASAPTPRDHIRDGSVPPITNLTAYIYHKRRDVQATYPDLYGRGRIDCLIWFFQYGTHEHGLDPIYSAPILERFLAWANAPDPDDPHWHEPMPQITKLAAYVYHKHGNLRRSFPDLYGKHRLDYLAWFIAQHAGFAGLVRGVVSSWAQACRQAQPDLLEPSR